MIGLPDTLQSNLILIHKRIKNVHLDELSFFSNNHEERVHAKL